MVNLAGIDCGTTKIKGVMIDEKGKELARTTIPKEGEIAKYGIEPISEQEPDDWIGPAYETLRILTQESKVKPDAIGVSGQMHGLVVVDRDGIPLRNAIIWDDRRTDKEHDYIMEATRKDVGHFTIAKLLWIKNNEPDIFKRIYKIMLPEDYVAFKLTGKITTSPQGLSQMRLWDFEKGCLDEKVLEALEIPESIIPEIIDDIGLHGKITSEIAGITGLSPGTPIYAKAGDQESAAVGNGVVVPGWVGLNSGTSGVIAIITDDNRDKSGKGVYWMKHLNEYNMILACTLSCGASYQWLRDNLFPKVTEGESIYPFMNRIAEEAPVGSEGVIWLPYLKGERSPRDDSTIRAGFLGIGEGTKRSYLVRAVLEGVAHSFRHCQEVLAEQGNTFEKARATKTGLLRSDLFGQILADNLGVPIEFVDTTGGCYGVALAAGIGLGVYESLEAACNTIRPVSRIEPNKANKQILDESYRMYVALGDAIASVFAK